MNADSNGKEVASQARKLAEAVSLKLSTPSLTARVACANDCEECYTRRMPKGDCSICSAPPDVLAATNEALLKKEKLRDLAARSGFSRAALSRHSIRHIPRDTLATHKAGKFNQSTDCVFVEWPNGAIGLQSVPHNFVGPIPTEPREQDIIVKIQFEPPPPPRIKQTPH